MAVLKNVDIKLKKELNSLPKDFWDFKESDTKELTHSIHNYPAVMVYPISRSMIAMIKKYQEIEVLLDPFMGSGTVLLEGVLADISEIYGNDLNPLANRISKAKITILEEGFESEIGQLFEDIDNNYKKYKGLLNQVDEYVAAKGYDITAKVNEKGNWGENAPNILKKFITAQGEDIEIPNIKNLGFWFVPSAIIELQLLRMAIQNIVDRNIRDYCEVAFSETVRLVSNRRNGEFKMYRMEPEKVLVYKPQVRVQFEKILKENIEKMKALRKRVGNSHSKIHFSFEDAAELNGVPDESVDLVITSPPYGDSKTTVAYGQFSRVSLQWCDYDKYTYKEIADIDKHLMGGSGFKEGFRMDIESTVLRKSLTQILKDKGNVERAGDIYSFYKDLEIVMQTISRKCKTNSYQIWVVGNRTVKGVQLMTNEIIVELGKNIGLKHVITLKRNISNKVMPSMNSPSNKAGKKVKTMNEESIVILRKEG